MSGIMKVRGKGKLEIIFIGSGAGGGTGMKFGDGCVIIRKDSKTPGKKTNILVNYGGTTNNFPITVYYPPPNGPAPALKIIANEINAILPTSLAANHINKIADFVKNQNTLNTKLDLIVPSMNFANDLWNNHLKVQFPGVQNIGDIFILNIMDQPNSEFDDIGINYSGALNNIYKAMFDERIEYSSNSSDELEFFQGKHV